MNDTTTDLRYAMTQLRRAQRAVSSDAAGDCVQRALDALERCLEAAEVMDADVVALELGHDVDDVSDAALDALFGDDEQALLSRRAYRHEWQAGSGRPLTLTLTDEQVEHMTHSGDCQADVEAHLPHLADQVAKWDPATLADELREYGAWDDEQLADHAANVERMVWIAAGDVKEEQRAAE